MLSKFPKTLADDSKKGWLKLVFGEISSDEIISMAFITSHKVKQTKPKEKKILSKSLMSAFLAQIPTHDIFSVFRCFSINSKID